MKPDPKESDIGVAGVIVSYNSASSLSRCIDSVSREGITQFIVVDNDSTDGSWQAVDPVRVIRNKDNRGFAAAVNQGVSLLERRAEFLLLLNPDAWLGAGSLRALQDALVEDGSAAAAGPTILNLDGEKVVSARRFPSAWKDIVEKLRLTRLFPPGTRRHLFQGALLADDTPQQVDWVSGACMLVRRTVWDQLQGFDEGFFLYGEELDWCWRARRAGWRVVYQPASRVTHIGGASVATWSQQSTASDRLTYAVQRAARRNMTRLAYTIWRGSQSLLRKT
jgi:GT2 family glycosyltransferase